MEVLIFEGDASVHIGQEKYIVLLYYLMWTQQSLQSLNALLIFTSKEAFEVAIQQWIGLGFSIMYKCAYSHLYIIA